MRETVRFAERYTRQLMLLSQEKFGSIDEVRAYISDRELKITEVQAYREHWKNKLRSAKTPEQAAEYTQKRNRCTEMLKNLRFQKQVAGTLVTDEPKIKRLLKSEQNIQRGNDPYEWANGYRMRDAKPTKYCRDKPKLSVSNSNFRLTSSETADGIIVTVNEITKFNQ